MQYYTLSLLELSQAGFHVQLIFFKEFSLQSLNIELAENKNIEFTRRRTKQISRYPAERGEVLLNVGTSSILDISATVLYFRMLVKLKNRDKYKQ